MKDKDASTTSEPSESGNRFREAWLTFETLQQYSEEILSAMETGEIPRLTQLLMKRGQLIEHLQQMDLQSFEPSDKTRLQERMDTLSQLEPRIQDGLKQLGDKLGTALKNNREWRVAVCQYKQNVSGEYTRIDEA